MSGSGSCGLPPGAVSPALPCAVNGAVAGGPLLYAGPPARPARTPGAGRTEPASVCVAQSFAVSAVVTEPRDRPGEDRDVWKKAPARRKEKGWALLIAANS